MKSLPPWLLLLAQLSVLQAAELPGVSHELAIQRAKAISNVRYHLTLQLTPDADRLPGDAEISFDLAAPTDPVVLDYRDGDIREVTVNQAPATPQVAAGHIVLDARAFQAGHNTIALHFESAIAASGRAITRYRDRDDGAEYIYTLFVPMDASQAFPCFDQPDLKARFDLDTIAPDSWTVISNGAVEEAAPAKPGFRHTDFAETRPLPTYLFAFAAGPFKMVPGEGFRMYVRQSQVARATQEAPDVLHIVREGVRHMAEYFGRTFPFSKYDLVLIPGLAYGGMEHAGATFLREESILFRSVPTDSDKIQRAVLLLHETAHQWFGDLVTMRWFDDLWLKEGFAQYMAYETLATLYPPDDIWKRFYQSHKPAAYAIDATHGTTPIHQSIANLADAKSAYGAIVYSKAPGLLRQLAFIIGDSAFRDGVRLFLREHAYGNAEWRDLIEACERASGQHLKTWADAWIRQPGMPQINTSWSCAQGRIDRFVLHQKDVLGEGRLWPIRTQLLLGYDGAPPVRFADVRLDTAESAVPQAQGQPCPAYIFANDRDYAYGRFLLDPASRESVIARIGKLEDPFLRALLWGALWDAVRELDMPPADYLRLGMRSLPAETDESLTQSILGHVALAYERYLSDAQRVALAPELEAMLEHGMRNGSTLGLRIVYYRTLRAVAVTPEALGQLQSLLAAQTSVPGLELKPLDRWLMITTLVARGDPHAAALLAAEQQRDSTNDGHKYAYVAAAARPDAATKQQYFKDYLENRSQSEDWIEASLAAFNSWNQTALTLPFLEPSLDSLPQIKSDRKIFFVLGWLNAFIGGQQTEAASKAVHQWLTAHAPDPDLQRKILEVLDELDRTVRIRARYAS